MKKVFSMVYFFFFASLLFSVTAFAYFDPASMLYIIQIIAGVAIAIGAGFTFYFRKFKRSLSKLNKKKDGDASQFRAEESDDDDVGYGGYEMDGTGVDNQAAGLEEADTQADEAAHQNRAQQ